MSLCGAGAAALEPHDRTRAYLSRVGEEKKKTPLGHRSPASLTGIGTLPKMACRCNLAEDSKANLLVGF